METSSDSVRISELLQNLLKSSEPAVGSDDNIAKDNLVGDWQTPPWIDDADAIRLIKTPDAYRAELISNDTVTDSANATKVPESVAWVAIFMVFTMHLIPISHRALNVPIDFGHGDVERFCADRIYLDSHYCS